MPLASGGTSERAIIRHPGSIVVLPLLSGHRIVLIRNWRIALERFVLELPAGTLKPGEDPATCARRELIEETGFEADTMRPLLSFLVAPGLTDERMHAFVASDLHPANAPMDEDERIEVVPTPWESLRAALDAGEIEDAKSMLVLHTARARGLLP